MPFRMCAFQVNIRCDKAARASTCSGHTIRIGSHAVFADDDDVLTYTQVDALDQPMQQDEVATAQHRRRST